MKLMMSDYNVTIGPDTLHSFRVLFRGPKDSVYEGGMWCVNVELPNTYPYKSPSIGFVNKIFHPNVDFSSGTICLDVINQTWSPMFDLLNIFDVFLPQLLMYPNPDDPLNSEAAQLMLTNHDHFKKKVKECIELYASDQMGVQPQKDETLSDISDVSISDGEDGENDEDDTAFFR